MRSPPPSQSFVCPLLQRLTRQSLFITRPQLLLYFPRFFRAAVSTSAISR
jgi:hypothetical protein